MEYRPLGRTGITVSHLTLGAMMFGALGNRNHKECVRIIHRALDAGITTVNTADGYSVGESEEIRGEALSGGRREEVMLTVKFGVKLDGNPNHGGGSRRWIPKAVEGSLRRLRTDRIDVYELGAPDPDTDIDETLDALTDLVRAGKIRSFGTSKMPPSQIAEARTLAERRGHGVFRTEETPYSILNRAVEYDLLPTCHRLGIGVLAFGPLAGGWLSGRYRKGSDVGAPGSSLRARGGRMDATTPANAAKLVAADALGELADGAGLTLPQLATAFVARHPAVSTVLIGPRTMEQLEGVPDRRRRRAVRGRTQPYRRDRPTRVDRQHRRRDVGIRHPCSGRGSAPTLRATPTPAAAGRTQGCRHPYGGERPCCCYNNHYQRDTDDQVQCYSN